MPGPRQKEKKLGYFWSGGKETFLGISERMLESAAFKTLTPTSALILLDWLRYYYVASGFDTLSLRETGFSYTWSMCRVDVSEETFNKGRRAIVKREFFKPVLDPNRRGGKAVRYRPSRDWEKWAPEAEDAKKIQRRDGRKTRRLREKEERQVAFRTRLHQPTEEQNQPQKIRPRDTPIIRPTGTDPLD